MISTEHLIGIAGLAIATSLFSTATRVVVDIAVPPPIEGQGDAPDRVTAGSVVPIWWSITKRTECAGESARVWNGTDGFFLQEPLGPTNLPASTTPKVYTTPTHVPLYAPPGRLTVSIDGFYECPGQPKVYFTLGPVSMEVVNEVTQ